MKSVLIFKFSNDLPLPQYCKTGLAKRWVLENRFFPYHDVADGC
jgi:hypothetical protein